MRSEVILLLVLRGLCLAGASKLEYVKQQSGVGCYECHSRNGSDPHCGDPFHPAFNTHRYHPKCKQGMDNRVGLFPARYCTKIKGTNQATNEELIVRSCSILPLENVCCLFNIGRERYKGCLMSCDTDACNGGHPVVHSGHDLDILSTLTITLILPWAMSIFRSL